MCQAFLILKIETYDIFTREEEEHGGQWLPLRPGVVWVTGVVATGVRRITTGWMRSAAKGNRADRQGPQGPV